MDLDTFRASLDDAQPPQVSPLLTALWHAGRDEWDAAHRIAQDDSTKDGAWVHAHLHRVEGDDGNAGYWYRRAGRSHCQDPLDEEWAEIAKALLGRASR